MLKVLLFENSPSDALSVREQLMDACGMGIELTHAVTLNETLACLRKERFDAVLCDLELPDSQGFTTFQQVQSLSPQVPVVLLTAQDAKELAPQALQAGAQDCLHRHEIDGRLLLRAIRYAIARKCYEQALRTDRKRSDGGRRDSNK